MLMLGGWRVGEAGELIHAGCDLTDDWKKNMDVYRPDW